MMLSLDLEKLNDRFRIIRGDTKEIAVMKNGKNLDSRKAVPIIKPPKGALQGYRLEDTPDDPDGYPDKSSGLRALEMLEITEEDLR